MKGYGLYLGVVATATLLFTHALGVIIGRFIAEALK